MNEICIQNCIQFVQGICSPKNSILGTDNDKPHKIKGFRLRRDRAVGRFTIKCGVMYTKMGDKWGTRHTPPGQGYRVNICSAVTPANGSNVQSYGNPLDFYLSLHKIDRLKGR